MKLYTAEQAAEILQLSKWTVWKYGRDGKLKTVRFGRTVRYDLEGGHNESYRSSTDRADVLSTLAGDPDRNSSKLGGEI